MIVLRFMQRHGVAFGIAAGIITKQLVLPDDAPMWLEITVVCSVSAVVAVLLYKDGVTANRPRR